MPTTSSRGKDFIKTRLYDANEKRRAKEQLHHNAEVKRQKKMFEVCEVNGPRDILIASSLAKVKVEVINELSLSTKHKTLEAPVSITDSSVHSFSASNLSDIKLEVDSLPIVKVEETLELEEYMFEEKNCDGDPTDEHTKILTSNTNVLYEKSYSEDKQIEKILRLTSQVDENKKERNQTKRPKVDVTHNHVKMNDVKKSGEQNFRLSKPSILESENEDSDNKLQQITSHPIQLEQQSCSRSNHQEFKTKFTVCPHEEDEKTNAVLRYEPGVPQNPTTVRSCSKTSNNTINNGSRLLQLKKPDWKSEHGIQASQLSTSFASARCENPSDPIKPHYNIYDLLKISFPINYGTRPSIKPVCPSELLSLNPLHSRVFIRYVRRRPPSILDADFAEIYPPVL